MSFGLNARETIYRRQLNLDHDIVLVVVADVLVRIVDALLVGYLQLCR